MFLMASDQKHELTAAHHLLYLVLVGKDWRKAFTPPTNQRKLANGAFEGWVLFRAITSIHSAVASPQLLEPFGGILTPQMLRKVRGLLPRLNPYLCRPEDYMAFSFEAYDVPAAMLAPVPGGALGDA